MENKGKKMTDRPADCVVLKFGGTSVSSLKYWQTIASVLEARIQEGLRPVVVLSALGGMTNELDRLLAQTIVQRHEEVFSAIEKQHRDFARELGVDFDVVVPDLKELHRLITGAALIREISPRVRAQVMSTGEIMLTRLGTEFLKARGIPVTWCDARKHLLSTDQRHLSAARHYLHALCGYEPDPEWQKCLKSMSPAAIVTQGFIARDANGDTVLLGRGGSDTSAAYLAAKLGAARCEIWTDVPGMYTANPHQVPNARLLKSLDYDEALELASCGAKVLHPRCLPPLRRHNIPLHIKCMECPDDEGTIISPDALKTAPQVKAISAKPGVTLVSMETADMWHQVGFLAYVFDCFKKRGLSIDLVSTSETNVTVTLDRTANAADPATIDALLDDLKDFCQPKAIHSLALVSLVGKNIRTILHQLGNVLEVFEEQKIYLVSQAANDLNLTFVVDEEQSERLVRELHGQLFGQRRNDNLLGSSWRELFNQKKEGLPSSPAPWWRQRKDELMALAQKETPLYVYDQETIERAIKQLTALSSADRIFYSIKANAHPEILRHVYAAGLGLECVSLGELQFVTNLLPDMDQSRLLFTPNFAKRSEYEEALQKKAIVTLDNLHPLEKWPDLFAGRQIFVRLDPAKGRGHHKYVHTAGTKTKFGIPLSQSEELISLVKKSGARVVGLHAHVGSNIFVPETWGEVALFLVDVAKHFPEVKILDVGGGLGVAEKPHQEPLDLAAVDDELSKVKEAYPQYELWLEPGRFIVAEAGVLLARVTQTKQKGDYHYVGIDAGMNTLIRPALYGAYHEIVNLTRLDEEAKALVNVVGPICESGDILGYARPLASPQEGDVLLIATVGAYGRVMSSNYNLREPAAEKFLKSR